ncbi:MAG: DUF1015 domain-containing protein [Treponema sp.]|jgi:hypothetical protein|nr:DUF1015 domain-containing protein [Treponema sp.]
MDIQQELKARLAALGTAIPEILLPGSGIDLQKWAVIACDQFTQDKDFWARVKETTGGAPSALNLILPEIYLEAGDCGECSRRIHETMNSYLGGNIFAPAFRGCVYTERVTPFYPCRRGLVLALDLDAYDWKAGARSLIRATEGTVPERLPPRVEIRRGAALETPHILILIDDREDALLPGLGRRAKRAAPLYETSLMMGGGSVSGWALDTEDDWAALADGLEALARRSPARYGVPDPFLYAMGDGNHSLATAKAVWDEYKAAHSGDPDLASHPARWALAEVENLYDPGITFEPIHRLLFGAAAGETLDILSALPDFSNRPVSGGEELIRLVGDPDAPRSRLGLISGTGCFLAETSAPPVITESLQPLLDTFVRSSRDRQGNGTVSIDYIHGAEELFRLVTGPAYGEAGVAATKTAVRTGILLPPVKKSGLFETVARSGPLPRKSFSMGEGIEKRHYLECRKLFV